MIRTAALAFLTIALTLGTLSTEGKHALEIAPTPSPRSCEVVANAPPNAPQTLQDLRCTPEHPFWVQGRGFVAAADLRVGDRGLDAQGNEVVFVSKEIREERAEHYNFEVEDFHTYFVSESKDDPAIWVHNKCPRLGDELGFGGSGTVYRNLDEPGTVVKKYHDHLPPGTAALEHQSLQKAKAAIGDQHVVTSRAPTEGGYLIREEVTPTSIPRGSEDGWRDLARKIREHDPTARDWGRGNWMFGTTPGNSAERWILIDDPY